MSKPNKARLRASGCCRNGRVVLPRLGTKDSSRAVRPVSRWTIFNIFNELSY
ncbi:hypothetical protein D3C80_1461090 [compost metagenome]